MYTFLQTMVVMALAFLSLSAGTWGGRANKEPRNFVSAEYNIIALTLPLPGTEAFTSISAMKMPQMRAAERTTSLFLRGGTTGLSMAASTDKVQADPLQTLVII
jgi:hypothetical protein